MNSPSTIFVDSDIFVAMIKKTDANHQKARLLYNKLEKLNVSFATSNYVFAESITVISRLINHNTAIEFINNMRSADCIYSISQVTPEIEEMAIEIFKKQTSKNVSFVDCTNMALMKHCHFDFIFSFDEIYKKNGYKFAK